MHFSIYVIPALLGAATAAPAPTSAKRYVVHEKRDKLPSHWKKTAKLHEDSYFPIRIGLTQSNLHRADEFLMDVSHPKSPNYGKHWTPKEVAEMFAPSKEAVDVVTVWLNEAGITGAKQSEGLNWITANVTVEQAERLLKTSYFEYEHESGKKHIACEEYSVPEDIRDHIDMITPTLHFDIHVGQPKKRSEAIYERGSTANVVPGKAKSVGAPGTGVVDPKKGATLDIKKILTELSQCNEYITPDCLRALYKFPPNFPANPKSMYLKSQFCKTFTNKMSRLLWHCRVCDYSNPLQ